MFLGVYKLSRILRSLPVQIIKILWKLTYLHLENGNEDYDTSKFATAEDSHGRVKPLREQDKILSLHGTS